MTQNNAKKPRNKALLFASTGAVLAGVGGGATWLVVKHNQPAPRPLTSRYTAEGYGGYVNSNPNSSSSRAGVLAGKKPDAAAKTLLPAAPSDLIIPVRAAYAKGNYAEAEQAASRVVASAHALSKADPQKPAALKAAARARYLQAFASARRHDMSAAREHFAQLQTEAGALPDKGKVTPTRPQMGREPEPTLLESAAYQHAVCTSALGDKAGAEREYMAFMKTYPDSPLVQASIKRIARFHGGDIPKDAEAAWQGAMKVAQAHDKAEKTQQSLCAPQCLAELIKRQSGQGGKGKTDKGASVASLTREMKTNERGTSLADFCASAKRHGFSKAQGVALTDAGLQKQKLPVVALILPGHFVLVEQVKPDGAVRVWSPSGLDTSEAGTEIYPAAQWKQMWGGIALVTQ